jgi:hypothetical protein
VPHGAYYYFFQNDAEAEIPIAVLYFNISVTLIFMFMVVFYPLSYFHQGGKVLLLPPCGKAGKGV